MADPARKREDIQPDIRPDLKVIKGGGKTTPDRASLRAVNDQESSPQAPASGSVPEREEQPDFENNYESKSKATRITFGNLRSIFKRKGPTGLIIALVMGGGLGGLSLGGLGLLPFHIAEQFLSKYDTQNTSFTIRTNKIIANKLAKDTTAGCNVIQIACRYTNPSNKLLRNMERNGITAYDRAGNKIEPNRGLKSIFPNTRPASYTHRPAGMIGPLQPIPANEFAAKMRTDANLRAAFHKAYNPKFVALSSLSTAFKTVKSRFGFDGRNTTSSAGDNKKSHSEKLNERVAGVDTGARAAGEAGGEVAESFIKKLIADKLTKLFDKIAKAGKGSTITLIAGGICAATDIPGLVAKTARAYQLMQLVRYGAAIMNAIYAMKAGDATPADFAFAGELFTKSVDGKSPMDAFGMKYTLFGDTTPKSNNYKDFVPGGSVINQLRGVTQITDSDVLDGACDVAVHPGTGVAINAALTAGGGASLGSTAVIALINYGSGQLLSALMSAALPEIIKFAVNNIPNDWIGELMKFFFGDLTQNLEGEDVGDAAPSAVAHTLGQTANAGGNMPLTVDEAVAYGKVTEEVQLAYAEEDRATRSPFDATSPNTFLGSIVSQFLPYYGTLSSVGGMLSMVGNILPKSLGSILQPMTSAATDPKAQYTLCEDPSLRDTAAGPFCNPIYGIPPKYLDMDPQEVLDALIDSGDIDMDTGEPKAKDGDDQSLQDWIALCADGSTDNIASCKITDDKTARFAIYTIDHIIQQSMDEEVEATGGISEEGSSESGDPSLKVVVNKKHPNEPLDYVPPDLVEIGNGYRLRSEAAEAYKTMSTAAAAAGHTLVPVSAYRSYDTQVGVYNNWVAQLGQAEADIQSARPGYSEHQTGLAVDFNTVYPADRFENHPAGQWLAANSWQYGFVLRFPSGKQSITGYIFEPWHYRYIGVEAATDMHNKGVTTLEEYFNVTGGDYAYIRSKDSPLVSFLNNKNTLVTPSRNPENPFTQIGWVT
jgi:D-alanyl-D-alanine carboxypeptidase